MTHLHLEHLEPRDCPTGPPLTHPVVSIVGIGTDAQQFEPLTQVMVTDYASLLAPYGVGQGSIAAVVSLPDSGPLTTAQVNATILNLMASGQLPAPGPDSVVMVYTNDKLLGRPANEAAFHDVLTYNGQQFRDTFTWAQPWESVPATHEFAEVAAGQEIADPVDGQWFVLDGFNVSEFVLPGGQPVKPPQQTPLGTPPSTLPTSPTPSTSPIGNVFTLAVERLRADVFGLLARLNPAFAGQAQAAAAALAADQLHGTAMGCQVETQADAVFVAWLAQG